MRGGNKDVTDRRVPAEPREGGENRAGTEPRSQSGDSESDVFASVFRSARPDWESTNRTFEGKILSGGRIRVGKRIGGGAMGTVYEGEQEAHPVAIKFLNGVQEHQVYRLKTEFRALRELHHPNVVSVYELFREDDNWFFTMERIDGMPLHRCLEQRSLSLDGPDSSVQYLAELRGLFHQLIQGVAAIHTAGLVHRDLKPTNVLVSSHDRVVVIDFGLVSEQSPGGVGQTIDNRISGTFGYMSPEQARGSAATAASDCYALGAILRQLLALEPNVCTAVEPEPRQDAERRTSGLLHGASMRQLCARLTSQRATERPTTVELLEILHEWGASDVPELRREPPVQVPVPFMGRNVELDRLQAAQAAVLEGGAPLVAIHGPCGFGKSRLVREFLEGASRQGCLVLEGRCSEWESVPYKGMDGVMDRTSRLFLRLAPDEVAYLVPRHASAVLRVFPSLKRVPALAEAAAGILAEEADPVVLRRRAIAGLKDLFFRLAERRRVIVAIEDLQWADLDTLQIMAELLASAERPRLFWVVTARGDAEHLREITSGIARVTSLETITLGPFAASESRQLATAVLPAVADRANWIERIVEESQGVPQQIVEFAHELSIASDDHPLIRLSDALLARVDRLSPLPRRLLEVIATAVRPLTFHVAAACGLADVQESVRVLMAQHLVRSVALPGGEKGFDTYTEPVRKVVLHAMPEERIVAYHGMLVGALEPMADIAPEWLLAHYRGAGWYEQAKRYSIIVAKKALMLLSYDHAATMYLVALELTQEQGEDWVELNIRCANALTMAGRGAEAANAFVRAARAVPPEKKLELLSSAVEQWIRSGHLDEGVRLLRQTLADVGIAWPENAVTAILLLLSRRIAIRLRGLSCAIRSESEVPKELLRKLDALRPAQTVLGTYDYLRGAAFATLALPLALKAREPKRLLTALASEAIYAAMLDGEAGRSRVLEVIERTDELAKYAETPIQRAIPAVVRAVSAYWMGQWSDVQKVALEAEAVLRQNLSGTLWEATLVRSVRHTVLLHDGRFDEVANELPDSLEQAAVYDDRYTQIDLLRRSATLHLLNDEVDAAAAVAKQICDSRMRHGIVAMDHLLMSLVVAIHLYKGDGARAREELEARWKSCSKIGLNRFPLVRLTVVGMRADCVTADASLTPLEQARHLHRLSRAAGSESIAWARALEQSLRGRALLLESEKAKALAELNHAANAFATLGMRVDAARIRAGAGEATFSSGNDSLPYRAKNEQAWSRITHTLY